MAMLGKTARSKRAVAILVGLNFSGASSVPIPSAERGIGSSNANSFLSTATGPQCVHLLRLCNRMQKRQHILAFGMHRSDD